MVLDGNAVRSVDRAAALLLALGESQGEAGVTELARKLGLHKSTASRLLATLQKRGLVEQDDETGKYRLGLVVIRLAERAERTLDLRGIALPELERLARLTHETTGLGILDGDSMLSVAQADGPNLIAVGDWTGRATPLHCVASGKVLLSSLAEREVLRIVRRGLVSYTERTIVGLEPLLEELARIRRRGFATAIGEYELGLNAVAAPVHDARGNVIAAVDVWGPAFRVTPRRIPELAAQAREALHRLANRYSRILAALCVPLSRRDFSAALKHSSCPHLYIRLAPAVFKHTWSRGEQNSITLLCARPTAPATPNSFLAVLALLGTRGGSGLPKTPLSQSRRAN